MDGASCLSPSCCALVSSCRGVKGVSWRVLRQSGCLGVLALKRPDVLKTHELRQFRKGHQASVAVHRRARALKLRIHRLHGLGSGQQGSHRKDGELVANGTYFCKLIQKSNGNEVEHWTKLIVIN